MAFRAARRGFSTARASAQQAGNQYDRQLGDSLRRIPSASSSSTTPPAQSSENSTQSSLSRLSTGFAGLGAPSSAAATPPMRSFTIQKYAAPHDLSPTEMFNGPRAHRPKTPLLGPSRKQVSQTDPFLALGIDPLKEAQNPLLFSNYLTDLGRIQSRNLTGLSWKNQRKLGQAVRRARCMGVLPYWNKIPA